MKENDDIFFASGDGLVYLAKPVQKKYSKTFVWGHPFSTYVTYDRFFNLFLIYAPVYILDDPSPFPEKINGSVGSNKHSGDQY